MVKRLETRGWDRDILQIYLDGRLPILTGNMTGKCNASCIYCHTDAGEKDENELTLTEWKEIIDQSIDLGNEVLWIGGKGEPLLDSAFKGVIEHTNQKGLTTILNTNGTLVDLEMANFLFENNVSPEIKIISFDEDVYDYLAGVKGLFPLMRQGLQNLLDVGYDQIVEETDDARITRLAGMILLAKPAYDSLPEVFEFCRDHNLNPVISDVVAAGRVAKNRNLEELKLSPDENKKLLELASEIMGYPLERGYFECHIQYGLFVQNNGDLIVDRNGMSCDVCDYQGRQSIGNLRKISLEEGWNRIKTMRREKEAEIKAAYDKYKCGSDDCFSKCPMMIQSQEDYYKN